MCNAPSTDASNEPSLISITELEDRIKSLSPSHQKILSSYVKGYTVAEIADTMKLSPDYITEIINNYSVIGK